MQLSELFFVLCCIVKKHLLVFVESSVSERNVYALIEGAAAQGHTITIGGTLYSDAMGRRGTYAGTYIGMLDHNITTITKALGGVVREGGFAAVKRSEETETTQ